MIEIRRATSADAGALAELRWEFRSARQPPAEQHDLFVKRCAAWMRRELASSHWQAWAAVEGGAVVGAVWLHAIRKIPNPVAEAETLAYLSNLYVKESVRGGVGTKLLDAALTWARANGVERILLWPTRRSVTLYLRHGFSHGGEVMELKFVPSP
jgi:GNAT superfamily N-acetyltransferase